MSGQGVLVRLDIGDNERNEDMRKSGEKVTAVAVKTRRFKPDAPAESPLTDTEETALEEQAETPVVEANVVRGKTVEQACPVKLTDAELLDYGKRFAQEHAEIRAAEDELATFKAQIKARIEGAKARAARLESCISQGVEYRTLQCYEELDFDAKTVSVVRPDTLETVGFPREMNERELQRCLPGIEEPIDPKAERALFGDDGDDEE